MDKKPSPWLVARRIIEGATGLTILWPTLVKLLGFIGHITSLQAASSFAAWATASGAHGNWFTHIMDRLVSGPVWAYVLVWLVLALLAFGPRWLRKPPAIQGGITFEPKVTLREVPQSPPQSTPAKTKREVLTEATESGENPLGIGSHEEILKEALDLGSPAEPTPRKPLANDLSHFYRQMLPGVIGVSHEHRVDRHNSALVHNIAQFLRVADVGNKTTQQILSDFAKHYGNEVLTRNADFSLKHPKNIDVAIDRAIREGPQNVAELHIILDYLIAMETGTTYWDWNG